VVAASFPPEHMSTLAGSRIQLKLNRLRNSARIIELPTIRVSHLAEKPLRMRHKTLSHSRNLLKLRCLQRDE
jgi:hypothetical protein